MALRRSRAATPGRRLDGHSNFSHPRADAVLRAASAFGPGPDSRRLSEMTRFKVFWVAALQVTRPARSAHNQNTITPYQ
jgi:hypothetical protein